MINLWVLLKIMVASLSVVHCLFAFPFSETKVMGSGLDSCDTVVEVFESDYD